ncbi:hypothetical protein LIA77_11327 [Sarocladium implicatum]|nr:hypothetical protein LIA77_11327 [Sarocladium implicatum]
MVSLPSSSLDAHVEPSCSLGILGRRQDKSHRWEASFGPAVGEAIRCRRDPPVAWVACLRNAVRLRGGCLSFRWPLCHLENTWDVMTYTMRMRALGLADASLQNLIPIAIPSHQQPHAAEALIKMSSHTSCASISNLEEDTLPSSQYRFRSEPAIKAGK